MVTIVHKANISILNISGRQVPWRNVEIALCELGAGRLAQSEGCEVEPPVRAGRCRGATLRSHFVNLAPDDVHDPKVVR